MSVLLPIDQKPGAAVKRTVPSLRALRGVRPVTALTAYDYTMASWLDAAGTDILLVGDSLGNVIQGHSSTLPVTMDQMVYHTQCVARAARHALVVADMPFGSFQVSARDTVQNAIRLIQEGAAAAVKIEGATESTLAAVRQLVADGIPVMGHVGLTPQSVHAMGGFRKQGKDAEAAERIVAEALALEEAGAFAVVLECIPEALASRIRGELSHSLSIGIGSGADCDGQILVSYDLLGMLERSPSFAPRYAELRQSATAAVQQWTQDLNSHHKAAEQA